MAGGTLMWADEAASPLSVASRPIVEVLRNYCVECHDSEIKKGGLALDVLDASSPEKSPEAWEQVIRKLRHRQMPPVGQPRPDESTYDSVVSHLQSVLDRAAAAQPNPGRTDTFRRFTRFEYRNAIRDLLALDVDVSELLPKDEISHGFDNITVGELSPTSLEKYLSAARKISALALGRPIAAPSVEIIRIPLDLTQVEQFDGLPFGTRGGAVVPYHFPLDAEYELQLRLTRDRNEKVEGLRQAHEIELLLDGKPVRRFEVKAPGGGAKHDNVDRHLNIRIPVKAGPHEIGATFVSKSAALLESERQPTLAHFNADRHARPQPALYSITVTGPYNSTGPGDTPSRRRVFSCYPGDPSQEASCATNIIAGFMGRAFRRPVSARDLEAPLRFYEETRKKEGFEGGIEMALRAILTSPHFLFRIEQDPDDIPAHTAYPIPGIQLASRLSFFLWSSIPDDELLGLAIRGELRNPATLEQQVKRMLRDRRSDALAGSFAAQWLYLRNLDSARPDARLFMDFDDNVRQALHRETELFFGSVLREDRNVLDLLRADYTYLNERLAKHYGIPNIYGSQFRRVSLAGHAARGGLLTQGSILTVTSHANRTSPVLRGNWVLGNILGMPPKPPPPDVPQLKEKTETGKALSIREQMAEHRKNKTCATCHNLMDPVGFALENYDAIGRWRADDGGLAVDASGSLSDGSQFNGALELERAILKRPELFVTTLTEKLLTYSLGRGLEYYDAPAVRKIVSAAARNDYRFSSVILGIVNSTPFQMRTSL
jgi:hypothetical protein